MNCIRIYNNGDRVELTLTDAEVSGWLEHNKLYRPGCALVVDGVCFHLGYLSKDRIEAYGFRLHTPT